MEVRVAAAGLEILLEPAQAELEQPVKEITEGQPQVRPHPMAQVVEVGRGLLAATSQQSQETVEQAQAIQLQGQP